MKKVYWRVYADDELQYTEESYEEAVEIMTEVVLENALNLVFCDFPPEMRNAEGFVSDNLEDILCTLSTYTEYLERWEIRKETIEVDVVEMDKLRELWMAQMEQDLRDWDQEEQNKKEEEERALLAKLKAKYE